MQPPCTRTVLGLNGLGTVDLAEGFVALAAMLLASILPIVLSLARLFRQTAWESCWTRSLNGMLPSQANLHHC
jgi:hypothetical protein